jgi:hypothetical protein
MRTWGCWMVAAALLAGCGGTDELPPEDDYAAAIPDGAMLALTAEEGDASTSGLSSGPQGFKELGDGVMAGVNQLVSDTQDGLRAIAMNAAEVDFTYQGAKCKDWEFDHEGNHWQLLSCEKDRRNRRFAYLLRGRPQASTADSDYLAVFAGVGAVHPRFDGKRRGAGVIGYDFDNYRTLVGGDVKGKVAIGYRAVGRARQLVVGLDKVVFDASQTEPFSALFRYAHVLGRGGRFVFWTGADVLTRNDQNQLVEGKDGTAELVRAAIAWNGSGAARTAYSACGGTVGQGCVTAVQCWTRTGAATYGDVAADGTPKWDEKQCPAVPFDVSAPDESVEQPGSPGEPGPIAGE